MTSGEGVHERKLVVILHADVVGSTYLVRSNESLAHDRIAEAFASLENIIVRYQGSVQEVRGDALVAEFARASDAVCAALEFQRLHSDFLQNLEDEIAPRIRIGVSLGEVVVANHTVTGGGVVLAQRVEQLADPGGLCVTSAIHEALPDWMPFDQEALGGQSLKGFDEPIQVYRITLSPGESLPSPGQKRNRWLELRGWPTGAASAVILACVVALIVWLVPWEKATEGEEALELTLAGPRSIAVLPFANMSGDKEQEYFSDGISEDLITDLSKISALTVIARTSSFVYKGQNPDVREVGKDLGVSYVLEGSVRKAGNQIRINAQLVDATSGKHLWAERYDGSYEDVFALQDKVTAKIVTTLAIKLTSGEQDQIGQIQTLNPKAYDAFLKGWEQYQYQRPESFVQAIDHFNQAIDLDSSYSRAYAALSATYWQIWKRYWHREFGMESPHAPRFKAEEYLVEAKRQPTSLALQVSTAMLSQQGHHDEALAEGQRAITLDPNDADGYVAHAGALNLAGQPSEAMEFVERAIRLNPSFPSNYYYELGLSQFSMDKFEDAAVSLNKATALNPDDRWSLRLLVATDGHLGRTTDAANILKLAQSNWGGLDPLSIRSVLFWYPFKEARDRERLVVGLRKAGVPE